MTSAFPLENLIKNQRCWFTSDLCIEKPLHTIISCLLAFLYWHFPTTIYQQLSSKKTNGKLFLYLKKMCGKVEGNYFKVLRMSFAPSVSKSLLRQKELAFLLVGHFFKISGSRSSFLSKKEKVSKAASWKSPLSPLFSFASINSKCSLKGRRQEDVS